ncbi:MAG: aminopeptidase [Hungatella sp.]
MNYQILFQAENESVKERYDLSMERIFTVITEDSVPEPYRAYFQKTAKFITMIGTLYEELAAGRLDQASMEVLQDWNHKLYEDILPEAYETSYANPAYAVRMLGADYGALLSFLYAELRGQIVFAYESRLTDLTILNEVFIEIYNLFEEELPKVQTIQEILYWFVSDYSDLTVTYRVREGLDPTLSFAVDLITNSDLSDLRYLYRFGEYIGESERKTADFLNHLPEETIAKMANTYTEGYRKGFEVMGRSLSGKKTVAIRCELGYERMVLKAMENFRAMGLEPILYRAPIWVINRNPSRKVGYYSTSPNKQYEYDHRYDSALYMKKALVDRKLAVLKVAYETYQKEAGEYAGPAVIETFGEEGFSPVNKPEAYALTEKQEKLTLTLANESARLVNQYIPGDETSFTIIAFPRPEIGSDFAEIFEEMIKINTLDYEIYKQIQQQIIDVLDRADYVTITGKGENHTNLRVKLHPLAHPEQQTNFENCVADVNIPLGEVFTSPLLAGTEGLLQVSSVYIGDIRFQNLQLQFIEGKVTDYSCDNFSDALQGRDLIRQMILKNHETLPMGEFAIGTNTVAYAMAQKFGIIDRLPILIAEKMGPHFAVGDTCYSWSEDCAVYNPDGKEIIARDNEISLLRKKDLSKAYFNCHTDITIPYRELDCITAVTAGGETQAIIENGKFVVLGTEELNKPLT